MDQPRFKGAGSVLAKRITYDDLGRPTSVEQPDEHGNMHAWTTDYDDWTTTFTQPAPAGAGSASLSRIETRDVWGRLSTAVDTMGNATVYNHDALGNLTKTRLLQGGGNDLVALRVQGDGAARSPVARVARPAGRMAFLRGPINLVAGSEDGAIMAGAPLGWADITDTAVPMLNVVPVDEARRP